jgi:hypothetical protein
MSLQYSGKAQDLKLVLEKPEGSVSGVVTVQAADGSRRPAQNVEVSIGPKIPHHAISAADGSFKMPQVHPGRYTLGYVRGVSEQAYLISATNGSRDVLHEDLVVERAPARLDIVLGERGGTVQGSVAAADGRKVQNALVALVPQGSLRSRTDYYGAWQSQRTDQNGAFVLRGLAPGSYEAFAWTGVPAGGFRNSEFMRRYEGTGIPVVVKAGETQALDLRLVE